MRSDGATGLLDSAAIGISILCAAHCLFLPVALVLVPSFATLPFADEHFHVVLAAVVLPTSGIALFLGCRRHRQFRVLALGATGMAVLSVVALFGHDQLGESLEKAATVVGATIIATGHVLNFRRCRAVDCRH